jgi:hypothetical protein
MPRICCDDEEEPGPNAFHRRRPKLCKRSASPSFSFQLPNYTVHSALRIEGRLHLPLITLPFASPDTANVSPLTFLSSVTYSIHSSYSSWTAVTLGTRRHEPTNDDQLEKPPSLLQPRRRHKEHDG